MVIPRWRPAIANSRKPVSGPRKEPDITPVTFPEKEEYIGSYIKSELGGEHVSNKSYEKYYGKMIKPAWNSKT